MATTFSNLLIQICGVDYVAPVDDSDAIYRMALLARFLAVTPSHLWRHDDRIKASHPSCPTCSHTIGAASFNEPHSSTCVYNALFKPTYRPDMQQTSKFLQTEWLKTKTKVVLEMGYHPCHILIAHMSRFPDRGYQHAGMLVSDVLDLEDVHAPTWDANTLLMKWPHSFMNDKLDTTQTSTLNITSHPPVEGVTGLAVHTQQCVTSSASCHRKERLLDETFKLHFEVCCKVCFKGKANTIIINCGHVVLCTACIQTRQTCPICLIRITESVIVYRS